ncbi:MAG: hypothetical protein ABEJ87_03430 [Candidatus Nanohalobium sp.]
MPEDEEGDKDDNSEPEKDKFGLPKLSTEAEMGLSMTLFVSGLMMVISVFYFHHPPEVMQAYVGLLLIGTAYLFSTEAVRELNEKDHFLAKRLMKRE